MLQTVWKTLEEIAIEGKKQFIQAGGINYKHIPCLNYDDQWVDVVCNWINNWENSFFDSEINENINFETNNTHN